MRTVNIAMKINSFVLERILKYAYRNKIYFKRVYGLAVFTQSIYVKMALVSGARKIFLKENVTGFR